MTETLEGGGRIMDPETGLIFPWYTSTCLEWLKTLDFKDNKVFEFGVGDSTQWYRKKGAIVTGVDSNYMWASVAQVSFLLNEEEYTGSMVFGRVYDIVCIDGDYRDSCTKPALRHLKSGGYLIIDNYHQPSVEPNIWKETDELIKGMSITIYKEPNHEDWQTAVITNP